MSDRFPEDVSSSEYQAIHVRPPFEPSFGFQFLRPGSWLTAIVGAALLLVVYRVATRGRTV